MNENRTFGIELELMCKHERAWVAAQLRPVLAQYGHSIQTRNYEHGCDGLNETVWVAKPDGSLNAYVGEFVHQCELVSPVLKGSRGLQVLEAVCNWLVSSHAFKITKKCGMHVHHGVTSNELAPLCRKWRAVEKVVHECLPGSRKHNFYCAPWCHFEHAGMARFNTLARHTPSEWYRQNIGTRYSALNLESFAMRGTVEFRNAAGTFEGSKAVNWVLVTQAIVEAGGLPLSNIQTFEQLAAFLGSEVNTVSNVTHQEIQREAQNVNPRAGCFGNHRRGSASALVDEMLLGGIHLGAAIEMLQAQFVNYANAPKTAERKFKGHVTYLIQRGVNIQRTGTYYVYVRPQETPAQETPAQAAPITNAYASALAWLRTRHEQFSQVPIVPVGYHGIIPTNNPFENS